MQSKAVPQYYMLLTKCWRTWRATEFHVHGLYHWAMQILLNSNVTYLLVHVMKMGCSFITAGG